MSAPSKMACAIVTQYGMSPFGTQVFGQPNHEVFLGRDYGTPKITRGDGLSYR